MRERVVADCTGLPVPSLRLHSRLFLVAFPCARVLNCKCVNCQLSDCQTESPYPIALPPAPSSPPSLLSPLPTLSDGTRVCAAMGLPAAWGMLSHLLQFLGHFSYSLSAINAAICKSNPITPNLIPLSAPPAAITPTSVINHAPCSKCSGGVSLSPSLSLSVYLLWVLNEEGEGGEEGEEVPG